MRKKYIQLSKLPQTVPVFFCKKERWKEEDSTRLLVS